MPRRLIYLMVGFLCLISCSKGPYSSSAEGGDGLDGVMPEGEVTISGKVLDEEGSPLAGVVVSDGFRSYRTDSEGVFRIDSDLDKAKFVSVSIPDGYKVTVTGGLPIFYRRLSDIGLVNGTYRNIVFRLSRMDDDRCTLVFVADPQPRAREAAWDNIGYHSLDITEDLYEDLGKYVGTLDGEVFGMMLGDIVHENMNLYGDYAAALKQMGLPMFNVIGNHDYNLTKADDISGAADYERWLGPTNYSFNLCGFHVVVIDNIIMKAEGGRLNKEYAYGLTDDVWNWLQGDLRFVDKSIPVILCSHAQMFATGVSTDRWAQSATLHGRDYAALLGSYDKVYSWAGHAHQTFNSTGVGRQYPNVESHTLFRSGGELWTNEWLCPDGVPRGYVVAQLEKGGISWRFKPMAASDAVHTRIAPDLQWKDDSAASDAQLRAYPRGAYGDNYVYANVFLWDEDWGSVKFVQDSNGAASVMTAYRTYDLAYKEVFDWYSINDPVLSTHPSSYSMSGKRNNIFRYYSIETSGSGHVEVTDRFGNIHRSATVRW